MITPIKKLQVQTPANDERTTEKRSLRLRSGLRAGCVKCDSAADYVG